MKKPLTKGRALRIQCQRLLLEYAPLMPEWAKTIILDAIAFQSNEPRCTYGGFDTMEEYLEYNKDID